MLCPAAVNVVAAAVWLLAVLGPGLSLSSEDNSEPGFTLCSHCFYRQTPPQGASAELLLHPLCHRLPKGQTFATLSKQNCDTAVYSAFYLKHGWTEGEQGEDLLSEEEDSVKVAVPALLRDPSNPILPSDSPLQLWDATVTTLVQSSFIPKCSTVGGDLYVLTGAGGLQATKDGDEECQTEPLWSAVCCAVPEGKGGFSTGLIRETEGGNRQVSTKELQEMLGMAEMFSEGCGGADIETVGAVIGLHSEGNPENIETKNVDAPSEETHNKYAKSGSTDPVTEAENNLNAQPEEVTPETSAEAVKSESGSEEQGDVRRSGAVTSEAPESSVDHETVDEQETDEKSTSTLVYLLSTTVSILKAPLHPVVSTVTRFPGQTFRVVEYTSSFQSVGGADRNEVSYVIQEDLGVLCGLPGETFSLLHLLTSDLLSWMGSGADLVLGTGKTCFSNVYYCTSSMVGALFSNCHTGITGVGTLAGDTVGVFGGALDNAWWVTKFFGGRLWDHSEGYVGTVMSEMGGQAKAVGGGLGRLVWRSGNGVYNVFSVGGGTIIGIIELVFGSVRDVFGQESE